MVRCGIPDTKIERKALSLNNLRRGIARKLSVSA